MCECTKLLVLGCCHFIIPGGFQPLHCGTHTKIFHALSHFCFTLSQVEGAVDANGRGQTIWDTFSHTPGKIADGSTADIADDFYDLYLDHINLMQANGIKNFRFSIAWSRIYPTGTGQVTCNCPFHAVQITLAYQLGIVAAIMGKPSATDPQMIFFALQKSSF